MSFQVIKVSEYSKKQENIVCSVPENEESKEPRPEPHIIQLYKVSSAELQPLSRNWWCKIHTILH